jgi:hypothetical protein
MRTSGETQISTPNPYAGSSAPATKLKKTSEQKAFKKRKKPARDYLTSNIDETRRMQSPFASNVYIAIA